MKHITNLRIVISKNNQSFFSAKLNAVLSELGCFKVKEMASAEYWKDKSRAEITYFFEETKQPLAAWESLFEKTVGTYTVERDNEFTAFEHFCSLEDENGIFAVLNIPSIFIE
jgi:hypothetical protein